MTSSFLIKNLKIDKFDDFSSDIDFNSKTDIFRYVFSLIINQCDPRRPKGASASRGAHASESRLYLENTGCPMSLFSLLSIKFFN